MNKGILYAVAAYGAWGFLPIYWKILHHVSSEQILAHRMVWSLVVFAAILTFKGHWGWINRAVRSKRIVLTFLTTALLIAANWYIYIWAVNNNYIVESSLGYFINPLVNVLFGVLFFKEKLRAWQWTAIGLAAAGVLYLTVTYGALPWIALALALTFGTYGVIKKKTSLSSLEGMSMETAILFLPALGFLLFQNSAGNGSFGHAGLGTTLLLAFTGIITALPLLWFSSAAQMIPLSLLGIIQYLSPTGQLLIGTLIYHEPFDERRLIGFSLIWVALLIYSVESFVERRRVAALQYAS